MDLITQKVEALLNPNPILSKRKALSVLFVYAASLGQNEHQRMAEAISRAASASDSRGFVWRHAGPYITTIFDGPRAPALNWVITLVSSQVCWDGELHDENAVVRWAATVLTVQDSGELDWSVVDALLQIASINSLRPHIPVEIWARSKRHPSLPPSCRGRLMGTEQSVVHHVRSLRDIEILKSYFLLVWSESHSLPASSLGSMVISIEEDFSGIGMWRDREDLVNYLDHILGELDNQLTYPLLYRWRASEDAVQHARSQYTVLRGTLLEVDARAMEILTRAPSALNFPLH